MESSLWCRADPLDDRARRNYQVDTFSVYNWMICCDPTFQKSAALARHFSHQAVSKHPIFLSTLGRRRMVEQVLLVCYP